MVMLVLGQASNARSAPLRACSWLEQPTSADLVVPAGGIDFRVWNERDQASSIATCLAYIFIVDSLIKSPQTTSVYHILCLIMASVNHEKTASVIPKACVNCRIRKIRCDKQWPCASCQTSGIECQPSHQGASSIRAAPPYRSPAAGEALNLKHLSDSIDQINASVQQLLALSTRQSAEHSSTSPGRPHSRRPSLVETSLAADDSDISVYEGGSSFTAQILGAGEASQSLARDFDQLAAAQQGLQSLRDVVHRPSPGNAGSSPQSVQSTAAHSSVSNMPLLPPDFVLLLLKTFKAVPSISLLAHGFSDIAELERLCHAAYFPTEPLSLGSLTHMHGLLYYLLQEWHIHPELQFPAGVDREAVTAFCEKNFDRGVRTYEIFANPTIENAKVLRMAAAKAQESSNIKRAWTNATCAARHLLNLGIHRRATLANLSEAEARDRLRLFWGVYSYDKSLALTLGHTSTIRDDDVDVDLPTIHPDPRLAPWDQALLGYVHLTRIESRIYDRLYTASALRRTPQERLAIVSDLSQQLEHWQRSLSPRNTAECLYPDVFDVIHGSPLLVVYNSLLTTLHRATFATNDSPGTITQACYDAACCALERHLEVFPAVRKFQSGTLVHSYLSWTLQYGAFTPLIVVFLHAISSLDPRDMGLLTRFQQSLEAIERPNPGTVRLQNASSIFSSVAQTYFGSQPAAQGITDQNGPMVRPEAVQAAFVTTQEVNTDPAINQPLNWETLSEDQINQMSIFVDNWMDGSQQAVELFNVDYVG